MTDLFLSVKRFCWSISAFSGTNYLTEAPVAQLDRVADFESVGCRFESYQAHQASLYELRPAQPVFANKPSPRLRPTGAVEERPIFSKEDR